MNDFIRKRYSMLKVLRMTARISSVLSIAVLLMFLFGEEFNPAKIKFNQWIGFLFFPVGIVLGFIIGWKYELTGGLISVISLLCFYFIYGLALTGKLPQTFAFLIFTIPGFLFVICGIYAYFAIGKLAEKSTVGDV